MLVLIDSYDSFSYNLYQLFGALDPDIKVFRNDGITVDELGKLDLAALILSPGPGRPEDAGVCIDVVPSRARFRSWASASGIRPSSRPLAALSPMRPSSCMGRHQ